MPRSAISHCPGECRECAVGKQPDQEGALRGAQLVGASILSFLLPLAAALVAAIVAGPEPVPQLLAATGALLIGGVLARGIALAMHWEKPGAES